MSRSHHVTLLQDDEDDQDDADDDDDDGDDNDANDIYIVMQFCLFVTKHRKNCECCPGQYLSTSVY